MVERFHDISFSRQSDGSIRLAQSDYGEDVIIDMHPAQLRHIAETFGLVAPNYPGDELSKQLAEQLCRVFLEMCDDYRHLSHTLEITHSRLDGFIDAMPTAIFPYHLWDEREERARQAEEKKQAAIASKQANPTVDVSSTTKTQPSATAAGAAGKQDQFNLTILE